MRQFCLFFLLLLALQATSSLAWDDDNTHPDISEKAAEHSVLNSSRGNYLKNLGFSNSIDDAFDLNGNQWKVRDWLKYGAKQEDESKHFGKIEIEPIGRFYNHFHNPLKPWDDAGLDSIVNGKSALLWAQDDGENEWAWQKVREYYRLALMSPSETERSANFAKTFRGLGQIIHLIQDMSQSAHG